MRRSLSAALAMAILAIPLLWASGAGADTTAWAVDGRQITVNSDPFMVQGMAYSPTPIGGASSIVPFGDYFIDQWQSITARDMEAMRKVGVNSVRNYGMWPYVKNTDFSNGAVASHADFLTSAYNGGTDPIYVFAAYSFDSVTWDFNDPNDKAARDLVKSEFKTLATQLADNPAIMGFVITNEVNSEPNRENPQFWQWINQMAGEIKSIAPDKLTIMSLVDDSMLSVPAAEQAVYGKPTWTGAPTNAPATGMPNLDVWGINSYRGTQTTGFDILFSSFEAASSKPLLLTEFGCPSSQHDADGNASLLAQNAQAQADYVKVHWNDIVANSDVASGGYVFEWTDEWWKNASTPIYVQNASQATNAAFPGGYDDEEWRGINGIQVGGNPARPVTDPWNPGAPNPPDNLVPRATVATLTDLWK